MFLIYVVEQEKLFFSEAVFLPRQQYKPEVKQVQKFKE